MLLIRPPVFDIRKVKMEVDTIKAGRWLAAKLGQRIDRFKSETHWYDDVLIG
jgi:hypothetical protein